MEESVATPPLTGADPSAAVAVLNVTDPVTVPEISELTVAVNVAEFPDKTGFGAAATVVVVVDLE
jgi:hypothetical protein